MSELMREALRRYQQPPMLLDLRECIRQLAPTPPAFAAIRAQARRKGTDKLTMAHINREVAAVRGAAAKKKIKRSSR